MSRRRLTATAALLGAALVGVVVTIVVRGGAPAPVSSAPPPVTTATVERTNLSTTVLTEGTLGYASSAPVVNRIPGTYTELPQPGTSIGFGQVLYRVDNSPVVLMAGAIPAWRPFASGMTDGPDVSELQTDLIALGDASGLLSTPNSHFDAATFDAVERWQRANGLAQNGQIGFGELVFLPQPEIVGASNSAPGQPAALGDVPYDVTTTTRVVTVPLNPDLPTVSVGEAVSIVLGTNVTTPGKVTSVGPAPASASSPSSSSNSPSSSSNAGQSPAASTNATVIPDDPSATGMGMEVPVQVSLTVQSVGNVLALPISALLALSSGGYGVEVVGPTGVHHLVGVTTGVFTGSQVQVSGAGIEPGTKVVVGQ